jgi:hypothetical protein
MTETASALMASIGRLIEAVDGETDVLRKGDLAALAPAAARKQEAAARYEEAMRAVAAEPGIARRLPEVTRRDLRAAARRLELALADNTRLVTAQRAASTRLVGRLIEAASQHSSAGAYTASGRLAVEPAALSAFRERV